MMATIQMDLYGDRRCISANLGADVGDAEGMVIPLSIPRETDF